jgi:hypothetical protein
MNIKNTKASIESEVINWVEGKLSDGRTCAQSVIDELLSYGCQSGIVSDLIYYRDTCAFFDFHKSEINGLLADTLDECGLDCPSELFGDKWDEEDPLAHDDINKNLLAWFAFETVASRLDTSEIAA